MWKLKETSASTTSSFLPFHFHFSVLLFFIHGFSSAPLPTALPNPTATTATKQILQVINLSTLSIFFIIEIPNHFPSFPPFILPTLFDILFIFTISLCKCWFMNICQVKHYGITFLVYFELLLTNFLFSMQRK